MVLHIDTEYIERYGLDIRELWVWTALKVLASNKPWQGTYQQLAKISNCGSKASAQRAMQVLLEKGLVIETDEGFTISSQNETNSSQNETDPSQNETDSSQNETESKEKEKYQKKIEKGGGKENIKDIKAVKTAPPPPPDISEVLSYGKEHNIPESICRGFFSHFTEFHWKHKYGDYVDDWKISLESWNTREKKFAAKQVPQRVQGKATTQEQAEYAGSQYAEYEQRKERERQADLARQQNPETQYIPYNEWKKMQEQQK